MSRLSLLAAALFFSFAALHTDATKAGDVDFHSADSAFPCNETTPKEFRDKNSDRIVIETSIRLSANIHIAEDSVDRIEYRLMMPDTFKIMDYLPKKELIPKYKSLDIGTGTTSRELSVVSLDAGGKVGFQVPVFGIEGKINRGTKDETGKEAVSNVQMSLIPPKELITSVSTQDRGRTLHFKLKQSNQDTLQGDKDFALLISVPRDWKGDCFTLECSAFLKGSQSVAAKRTLAIGLYKSGDLATKKQVEELAKIKSVASNPQKPTTIAKVEGNAADSFRTKYSGKYTFAWVENVCNVRVNLLPDGTFSGQRFGQFGTLEIRGTWSATDDQLILTSQKETIPNSDTFNYETTNYINSKIVSFDEDQGIIMTESGYKLKTY